jgi:hypothetical protein
MALDWDKVMFERSETRGDVRRNSSSGPFIAGISLSGFFAAELKLTTSRVVEYSGLPPLPSEKYKKFDLRDEFHKGGGSFF